MSTEIRAECPTHGEVRALGRRVRLVVYPTGFGVIEVPCRQGCVVRQVVGPDLVVALVGAKVRAERAAPPAEVFEKHHGPPISAADILTWIEEANWCDYLAPLADNKEKS